MRESRSFGQRSKTKSSDEVERKCFFFCEGEETEPIYFAKLRDLKDEVGISPLIDIIQIEKTRGEIWSNPKKMIDALCLDLSDTPTYNSLINAMVDSLYMDVYLNCHIEKIKEFEKLLTSFISDDLNSQETDLVEDVQKTIRKSLEFFKKERPRICNIIMNNVEEMLKNYNITFDKEIDFLCLVVDRDAESFTASQFDEVYNTCQEKGFRFLISNPSFEFWLLLHFDDVVNLDVEKIRKNEKINSGSKSSIRYLSNELRKRLCKYKKNRYDAESLVHNLNKAIKNEKEFCEALPDLKDKIGSNIGAFIEELRSYR